MKFTIHEYLTRVHPGDALLPLDDIFADLDSHRIAGFFDYLAGDEGLPCLRQSLHPARFYPGLRDVQRP